MKHLIKSEINTKAEAHVIEQVEKELNILDPADESKLDKIIAKIEEVNSKIEVLDKVKSKKDKDKEKEKKEESKDTDEV